MDDPPANVCQAFFPTLVKIGQQFVIESHQVQNRGVNIVQMSFVLNGFETEFVCCAIPQTAFDAGTSQPH